MWWWASQKKQECVTERSRELSLTPLLKTLSPQPQTLLSIPSSLSLNPLFPPCTSHCLLTSSPVPISLLLHKNTTPKFKSFETKIIVYFHHRSAALAGITLGSQFRTATAGDWLSILFPHIFLLKAWGFFTTWQPQSSQPSYMAAQVYQTGTPKTQMEAARLLLT